MFVHFTTLCMKELTNERFFMNYFVLGLFWLMLDLFHLRKL